MKTFQDYLEAANNVNFEEVVNTVASKLHCNKFGSCIHFVEMVVEKLAKEIKNNKIDFIVYEGYVADIAADPPLMQHTWIEKDGKKYDPTFAQFTRGSQYSDKNKKKFTAKQYLDVVEKSGPKSFFKQRRRHFKKL